MVDGLYCQSSNVRRYGENSEQQLSHRKTLKEQPGRPVKITQMHRL